MTGLERVRGVLGGESVDRLPAMPIAHTALARAFGVPLGEFFTSAERMAAVIVEGWRAFGFDGVQLTLGVTGEAEALGARVEQPADAGPVLREHLLAGGCTLAELRARDVAAGGRMPLFHEAVARVAGEIGAGTFVLATLRGPLLIASQLRGVKQILMDMIDEPEDTERILDFAVEVGLTLGGWLRASGAHGLLLGEATCSPDFIPPDFYRRFVRERHRRLVGGLHAMGWNAVGLHICGRTLRIIEDVIETGVDFMDVDWQVPASEALGAARGRIALRGNLDPSGLFRYGAPERVAAATTALVREVGGKRWILSSGCDIPPGTPREHLAAFSAAAAHRPQPSASGVVSGP